MRPTLLLAAAILIPACSGKPAASNQLEPSSNAALPPPAKAEAPAPKAVALDDESALLDWHLSYPAEVAALPALADLIRGPALKNKAELLKQAAADKAERDKRGFEFHGYEASTDAEVAGATPRLLSVALNVGDYTGGAHPNHGTKAMLWDKALDRLVTVDNLFAGGAPALQKLLHDPYCAALDKARKEKRGPEEAQLGEGTDDPFNACPKFDDLALIPSGKPGQLFTAMLVHADPYVAGPYAEGDYDIELPVTAALIAALKPEYRASFAARP